mgnify:CR=1 FL=1
MITIAEVKMDSRGRITLPSSFLSANEISHECRIIVKPKYNSNNEVILEFINGELDEEMS